MAKGYGVQLLGYRRTRVHRMVGDLQKSLEQSQQQVDKLQQAINVLSSEVEKLRAQNEEYQAALRHAQRQYTSGIDENQLMTPVTVMVGPSDKVSTITSHMDALDSSPLLNSKFRLFRDGFYRVDGTTENEDGLIEWLKQLPGTQSIHVEEGTVHIVPKEPSD